MNFANIQPISYLETNTSDVVNRVLETHEPVAITVNGRVQAVVQDAVSYQKTQDQLAMHRILALGRKQIEEGKVTDHDDVVALLEGDDNESKLHENHLDSIRPKRPA
jgi:prevent-host-death family protein